MYVVTVKEMVNDFNKMTKHQKKEGITLKIITSVETHTCSMEKYDRNLGRTRQEELPGKFIARRAGRDFIDLW